MLEPHRQAGNAGKSHFGISDDAKRATVRARALVVTKRAGGTGVRPCTLKRRLPVQSQGPHMSCEDGPGGEIRSGPPEWRTRPGRLPRVRVGLASRRRAPAELGCGVGRYPQARREA